MSKTMLKLSLWMSAFILFHLLLFTGCGLISQQPLEPHHSALYQLDQQSNDDLLSRHAPVFLVHDVHKTYNRIGTPVAKASGTAHYTVAVDDEKATVYTLIQPFTTDLNNYTNLIYRVNFSETPLPHLTSGQNVGLLIYITLDSNEKPVLITTLHTCGCYLAFIPTSNLPVGSLPPQWKKTNQNVFGESLPGFIDVQEDNPKFVFDIRSATHRVMAVRNLSIEEGNIAHEVMPYEIKPMGDLDRLATNSRETISFFETGGLRKGHVRGSRKPLEMILMSWWAMDFFIGEDKALGPPEETGAVLYTSLKIWDRDKSNIWFFPQFLQYWGWNL